MPAGLLCWSSAPSISKGCLLALTIDSRAALSSFCFAAPAYRGASFGSHDQTFTWLLAHHLDARDLGVFAVTGREQHNGLTSAFEMADSYLFSGTNKRLLSSNNILK